MAILRKIKEELEVVEAIRDLVKTYQEIATLKMRKIRKETFTNRKFFEELLKTYKEVMSLSPPRKEKEEKEKSEAFVFLSANEFLYGGLIWEIWRKVKDHLKESKADLIVVGRVGKYFAEKEKMKNKIFYFHLEEERKREEEIIEIVNFLKKYDRVLVFFGKYEGGLIQKPVVEEITKKPKVERKKISKSEYLVEPSTEEILKFFEEEILAVLFNLTLLEHKLAKYAARMVAMSEAVEKAKKKEKELKREEKKIRRRLLTKRQTETLISQLK